MHTFVHKESGTRFHYDYDLDGDVEIDGGEFLKRLGRGTTGPAVALCAFVDHARAQLKEGEPETASAAQRYYVALKECGYRGWLGANARRAALIEREAAGELLPDEKEELWKLQGLTDLRTDAFVPFEGDDAPSTRIFGPVPSDGGLPRPGGCHGLSGSAKPAPRNLVAAKEMLRTAEVEMRENAYLEILALVELLYDFPDWTSVKPRSAPTLPELLIVGELAALGVEMAAAGRLEAVDGKEEEAVAAFQACIIGDDPEMAAHLAELVPSLVAIGERSLAAAATGWRYDELTYGLSPEILTEVIRGVQGGVTTSGDEKTDQLVDRVLDA